MTFNKIPNPAHTKHYWKKPQNFKNTAYHLHTASTMFNIVPSKESFTVINYFEPPVFSQYSPQHFDLHNRPTLHNQLNYVCAWTGVALSAPPHSSSYCTMWTERVRRPTVNNLRTTFSSRSESFTVYALLPNRYLRRRLASQPVVHPSGRLCCGSDCSWLQKRGW